MVSPVVCGLPAAQRVVLELPPASNHRDAVGKIAENDPSSLGDTSTLADPGVVDDLVANRMNRG
jgi:hypothetical protein